MATLIASDDGVIVAFGLEWRRLTGLDRKNRSISAATEIRQYAQEIKGGAELGINVDRNASKVVGLLPKTTTIPSTGRRSDKSKKAKPRIYAAAEVFAATVKDTNAALVVVLGNNQYAFIGIKNRLPSIGFDVVGDTQTILKIANDFIRRIKETGVSFYFVGEPDPSFDISIFNPNTSLPDLFSTKNLGSLPASALVPVRQQSSVWIWVGMAILIGGISLWYKHQEEEKSRAALVRAKHAADLAAASEDPGVLYTQSVQSILAQTKLAATSAIAFTHVIGPLPATKGKEKDWKFLKADCSNAACTVTWQRAIKSPETNETIASDDEREKLVFLTDLQSVEETHPADVPADKVEMEAVPSVQDFLLKTGTRLQVMSHAGLTVRLGSGSESALKAVGTLPTKGSLPPGVTVVRSATWEISGDYDLRSALFELPHNMTMTSFVVEASPNTGNASTTLPGAATAPPIKFTAKGSFYVH